MSDFVAEIKPRSVVNSSNTSVRPKGDFIAEIRPKSHNQTELTCAGSYCYPQDESDLFIQKIISDRHFSRESISRLLERSVISLVEKLLTGRTVCRIEGSLVIALSNDESPLVIHLHKSFTKFSKVNYSQQQALDSGLNIKIKDRDLSSLYPSYEKPDSSCSPCSDFNRDPCPSPSGSDASSHMWHHIDRDSSVTSPPQEYHVHSPPHHSHISSSTHGSNSPSPTQEISLAKLPGDDKPLSLSPIPEMALPVLEMFLSSQNDYTKPSPIKLGAGNSYITNEKTDSDTPRDDTRNTEYFCSGSSSKNFPPVSPFNISEHSLDSGCCRTLEEESNEIETDDDDVEESDCHLVIDESPSDDLKLTSSEQSSPDEVQDVSDVNDGEREKMSGESYFRQGNSHSLLAKEDHFDESLTNEIEDVKSVAYSENIDIDSQDELPGNSKVTSDVMSLTPLPQSVVSKCPDGFRCKHCNIFLSDTKAVATHAHTVHDLYCCSYCCRTFTAKNNLKRHVRRHTGQRPYKCWQCPQTFSRQDDLKGHMIRHDYNKPFRCSVCKKGYTDRACVKNHMAKEHRSRVMHVCPQCGESYDSEEAFTTHKRSHSELKQFSCSTCSFIGTNKLMALKHSLVHNHKLFSCKPCNAYFGDPFHYTSHVKKHKKNTSFTNYVCCFCDTTLATYDQYIRHEYSHAQIKVHTCKICKKQFKNKSSLYDHVMTHNSISGDTLMAEKKHPGHVDIITPQSQTWQAMADKENHFLTPTTFQTPELDEKLINRSRDLDRKIILEASLEESQDKEFCGELLDLSMKKAHSSDLDQDKFSDEKLNDMTSVRAAGESVQGLARNTVVNTDDTCLSQQREVKGQRLDSGQLSNTQCYDEKLCRAVFFLKDHKMATTEALCSSRFPQHLDKRILTVNSKLLSSSESTFGSQSQSGATSGPSEERHVATHPTSFKTRHHLNGLRDRQSLRLTPYNREKMVDLAAKFMAARGTRLTGHREPLKAIIPTGEEKTGIVIRSEEICQKSMSSFTSDLQAIRHERSVPEETRRRDLVREAIKDNVEVMSDNTNSETTLRCHIPTVVKSEPLMVDPESPLDCRSQKSKSNEVNTGAGVVSGMKHNCEICKEIFGSFLELESHSVEVHKRYLCQHCRKSFTARPNRDRHVRYHTGERPYKCDLCDQSFYRGDDLKYHRTTRHPTAQPFVCTRCSASFTWGRDLERHIRHSKCNV